MPILVRHVNKDSELTAPSLLDMPIINSGSTAHQMYDVCNEVRGAFSLDWDNCVTYFSDKTNCMIRQWNILLQRKYKVCKVTKRFLQYLHDQQAVNKNRQTKLLGHFSERVSARNSVKTKWPVYFLEITSASRQYWKTKWPAFWITRRFYHQQFWKK